MVAVVFVLFAVAMIVGPLMLMRPSASQARIASLRTEAQKTGMRVRLDHNPFARENSTLAVYSLPKKDENEKLPIFSLFRKPYAHEINFCGEWDWFKQEGFGKSRLAALENYLLTLDTDIVGVESTKLGVSLYWRERLKSDTTENAVQKIYHKLRALKEILQS